MTMHRMRIGQLDPRVRLSARFMTLRHVDNPLVREVTRLVMRHLPQSTIPGVSITTAHHGALRIYDPQTAGCRPALLWIHGGGLVVGSASQDDGLCSRTAATLGIVVVSVDYRLAPEHPYPEAIDDVFHAWQWMVSHADRLRIDTTRLAIGGESAGGGLAACLVQRVHDAGGPQPIAQWLFAPMLDDRTAADRSLDVVNHFVWNNKANRFGWRAYLSKEPGSSSIPKYAAASRRSDLSGLPPAWLYSTDLELFHDEIQTYARRLRDAGIDVTLTIVPRAAHAFELFENTDPARQLLISARTWLGHQLGVTFTPLKTD